MAKKVLVTGEQGFIGSHFIKKTSSLFEAIPSNFDVLKPGEMKARLEIVKPDFILHLAGMSLPAQCDQNPELAEQVNTNGTRFVLESMRELKSPARFLLASTAQVYQPLKKAKEAGKEEQITEMHAIEPINLYARTKRVAEEVAQEYSEKYGLKVTVFRLFNHVHRSQKSGTFLGSLYQEMQKHLGSKNQITLPVGNLELYRDMGSIKDLLEALVAVITHEDQMSGFEVMNICNGKPRHLRQLADLLAQELKLSCNFQLDASRLRENDPTVVVGSHERLSLKTGWQPSVKTDEDLIRAFLEEI